MKKLERSDSISNEFAKEKHKILYNNIKNKIEKRLNFWDYVYLYLWEVLVELKLRIERWGEYTDDYYEDSLSKTLDYIWKMLKERKVMVELYDIEEYEKPREIEKVFAWGKFRKKYKVSWMWKSIWWLDPCKIEDEKELDKKIKEWKKKIENIYKYALEKYGSREASVLFQLVGIKRSSCYEWEIRIE